jgi:hypothetical protein
MRFSSRIGESLIASCNDESEASFAPRARSWRDLYERPVMALRQDGAKRIWLSHT